MWTLLCLFVICMPFRTDGQRAGIDVPHTITASAASIHSLKLHPVGMPSSAPIIPLENGQLRLSFDDFSPNYRSLELRIRHCTFDWYDSPDFSTLDYINGFSSLTFDRTEPSFNTKTSYTHYSTTFPNDLMQLTKSGNYMIEVVDQSNPHEALIQLRFVVFESLVDLDMQVLESSIIREQRTHQEVALTIRHDASLYRIRDAYDELQVVIMQNMKWETARMGLQPQFVRNDEVVYDPTGVLSFPGGNSWRFVDIKSLRFASLGIQRIVDEGNDWHAYLEADQSRAMSFLEARSDLDGHFVISNERQDDDTGGEYLWTHFVLEAPFKRTNEDIYIYGEISNWSYPESHRLHWNEATSQYEAQLFLKQGYYNYEYRVRPSNDRGKNQWHDFQSLPSDIQALEGSHSRADTPYTAIIYYWDLDGYDRVIGFATEKPNG